MSKQLLVSLAVLLSLASCATSEKIGSGSDRLLNPARLRHDVDRAYGQLKKLHPHLYDYTSKEILDYQFDSLKSVIVRPMSQRDFYFALTPVIGQIRQGHTQLIMHQNTSYRLFQIPTDLSVTPLHSMNCEWIENQLFITESNSGNPSLTPGTEILSIDGRSPNEWVKPFRGQVFQEGYSDVFSNWKVNQGFPDFFLQVHGPAKILDLQVRKGDSVWMQKIGIPPKNTNKAKDAAGKIPSKIRNLQGFDDTKNRLSKEFQILGPDSSVGLLVVRDFFYGNYLGYYSQIFQKIDSLKIKHLILDLRGNEGGRAADARTLYSFLADSSFRFINGYEPTSRNSIFHRNYFYPFPAFTWPILLLGYPPQLLVNSLVALLTQPDENGQFKVMGLEDPFHDQGKPSFSGNLYVLTDSGTFSAAAILASVIRYGRKATFIGTETGGAANGCVAYFFTHTRLPESRLVLVYGLYYIEPAIETSIFGHGIQPDIEIRPTLNDRLTGQDPELNAALECIRKK